MWATLSARSMRQSRTSAKQYCSTLRAAIGPVSRMLRAELRFLRSTFLVSAGYRGGDRYVTLPPAANDRGLFRQKFIMHRRRRDVV